MFGTFKLYALMPVVALLFAASSASATYTFTPSTTACSSPYGGSTGLWYGPYGSGSNVIHLAVAANFTEPLDYFLQTYFVPSYGSTDTVYFCADSTSNLEATINAASTNPYDMLFAADSSTDTYYSTYSPYLYAHGVPALFGYLSGYATNTISSVSDLITTGGSCTISSNLIQATPANLSGCTISSTLTAKTTSVVIANPLKAPYGDKAANILDLTLPIYPQSTYSIPVGTAISPAQSISTETDPTWMKVSTTYANITKAYNAVGTGTVYAGFVALSQIHDLLPNTITGNSTTKVAYVEFTDSNFILNQKAVSFTTNDVNTQIKAMMRLKSWNGFLTSWLYQTI